MMMTLVARLGVLGAGSGGQVQALAAGRQAVGGVSYRVAQLRCQRRCLSFGDAGAATVTAVEHGLVALKASTGMPWWAAICATAAVTRLAVLLPAAIKSEEHRSRIELLGPTLREWSDALRFKVYSKARREGQSQEAADHQLKKEVCLRRTTAYWREMMKVGAGEAVKAHVSRRGKGESNCGSQGPLHAMWLTDLMKW